MSTIGIHRLRHLALFALTAEEGSFANAARKAKTSRSRISEQISELEADLGLRLFHRSTRQLTLTEDGKRILQHSRQLGDVLDAVTDIANEAVPAGVIRITTTIDLGLDWLVPVMARFQGLYPEIRFDIRLDDDPVDLIAAGIDMAIRVGLKGNERPGSHVFHHDAFAIFASPSLLDQYGMPDNVDALQNLPWLTFEQVSPDRPALVDGTGHPVRFDPVIAHRCNSPIMMQQMMLAGMGAGLALPALLARPVDAGDLVRLLPDIKGPDVSFSLILPSRHHLPLRIRMFRDFLLESPEFSF